MEKDIFKFSATGLKKIKSEKFSEEKDLQNLLENIIKNEKKLLSHKIIGYKREHKTSAGRTDFLLVDTEGRVIITECKLVNNEQIRRKIIAQLIDYASDYSDILKIKDWITLTGERVEIDIENNEPLFCIVSDGIHPELHRINTFLTSKNFIIKMITINKFTINNNQYFTISAHESEPDNLSETSIEKLNFKIVSFGNDAEKVRSVLQVIKSRFSDVSIKLGKKRIAIHVIGSEEKFAIWLSQAGIRGIEHANISIPKSTFEPCSQESYDKIIKKLEENFTLNVINYDDVMYFLNLDMDIDSIMNLIENIRDNIG